MFTQNLGKWSILKRTYFSNGWFCRQLEKCWVVKRFFHAELQENLLKLKNEVAVEEEVAGGDFLLDDLDFLSQADGENMSFGQKCRENMYVYMIFYTVNTIRKWDW